MKDRKLKCWTAALAALVLAFAGACSDGSDGSESSGSASVSGTYSGESLGIAGSATVNKALADAVQSFADEEDGTFEVTSVSIELGSGYTVVLEGTWTQTYGTFSFVYTITGSYTASGSAIALGEPDVKIQYVESEGMLADYTDEDEDSVEAIKTIIENISLTYSNGGLVIDFSALDEYIASLDSEEN